MSFILRHSNVNQFARKDQRHSTIGTTVASADVATLNEVLLDHADIAAFPGFDNHTVGENSILWRRDKFTVVDMGWKSVMVGGRRGTGAPGDHRRRGPSRNVVWVVLEENATHHEVLIFTHHAIARADTVAKWRRPLRALGFTNVGAEINRGLRRNPSAELVGTGDLNTLGRVDYPSINEVEIATPNTFGRTRYDRIHAAGAKITSVSTFTTRSDHKGLQATVTLGGAPAPLPDAPTPGAPPKRPAARPVPRPWRRRSRRWKRLHPVLWRRILAWRKKHPRRRHR